MVILYFQTVFRNFVYLSYGRHKVMLLLKQLFWILQYCITLPSFLAYIIAHNQQYKLSSSVARFLVWGGGGRGKTPKCIDRKTKCTYITRAREASERLRNIYFQDSKYICLVHIKPMQFPLLYTYGMALKTTLHRQNTKVYEYASEL